jgi:hypothetical protein
MCKSHRIVIKLLHQHALPAYISTSSGGTFILSASNPSVTLLFNDCVWDVENNFQNIHSFYPTTQQGIGRVIESYKGTVTGFNQSSAISADGNTFVVGISGDDSSVGAAFVYVRRDKCWSLQAKLVGANANVSANTKASQGASVALSADGNTLAIGGPQDNVGVGATWIFVRRNCQWIQQGPKLVKVTSLLQGASVSLSADGNTLAVGAPNTLPNGRVTLYNRLMGAWVEVGDAISIGDLDNLPPTHQGALVELSSDATTLVVGADDYIIIYTVNSSIVQKTLISAPSEDRGFGISDLALSSDGFTLAVGDYKDDSNNSIITGAVRIYVNIGGVWSQQGVPLYGIPTIGTNPLFGVSVDLTADGNTLVVGSPNDNNGVGATFVFTRISGTWIQRQKLISFSTSVPIRQGGSVSISSEGNTLLVANEIYTNNVPMFWIYV